MAESEYCDDYYEYFNDDCDGDCNNCNYTKCDEHPHQKYLNSRWKKEQKNGTRKKMPL